MFIYKLDYEMVKAAHKITKIPRILKKLVPYLRKASFCSSKSF